MLKLLVLVTIITVVAGCRRGSGTGEAVSEVTPMYNCTGRLKTNHTAIVEVNALDHVNHFCTSLVIHKGESPIDLSEQEAFHICNYIGSHVCPNCSRDKSYSSSQDSFVFHCYDEPEKVETTTIAWQTTTYAQVAEQTTQVKETDNVTLNFGGNRIIIYLALGIGAIFDVMLLIFLFFCYCWRNQSTSAREREVEESSNITASEERANIPETEAGCTNVAFVEGETTRSPRSKKSHHHGSGKSNKKTEIYIVVDPRGNAEKVLVNKVLYGETDEKQQTAPSAQPSPSSDSATTKF